jgi:hypothetical protein
MTTRSKRSGNRREAGVRNRKVCLYLADDIDEIDAVAEKLGISRSKLLVLAWEIARAEIAAASELPPVLHRKSG